MHLVHPTGSGLCGARAPLVALGTLLCLCLLFLCGGAKAQSQPLDTALSNETVETGVLGEPQLIEADVGAETNVSSIVLYYRFDGEREYRSLDMRPGGAPGVYAASVPTDGVRAERLEFYILAEDATGDALLKGNSFEPLERELLTPEADLAARDVPPPDDPDPVFGRSKYLWYALGALAVGALVVAASDSDDGGSDEGCAEDGCNLTLVLPAP